MIEDGRHFETTESILQRANQALKIAKNIETEQMSKGAHYEKINNRTYKLVKNDTNK